MTVLSFVLLGLASVYALLIAAFSLGYRRVLDDASEPVSEAALPFVSVIVPARDEAACIGACVDAILANDYPADHFELIVVDDLSDDATPEIVRGRIDAERIDALREVPALAGFEDAPEEEPASGRLMLLQMPENLERQRAHKKRAIEKGIAHARGAVILTTDADCAVPSTWIRTMATAFGAVETHDAPLLASEPGVALVSGPVLYAVHRPALLQMQALEFLGLVAVGAGAIGAGRPTLCNGANVAYRRDVFDALGGFHGIDHLTSGDDELLMQKIADQTDWQVRFCNDPAAAVATEPMFSLGAFVAQRARWASKGAHYPNPALVAMCVAIFSFFVLLIGTTLALPFVPALGATVAGAWALKLLPEWTLLAPFARRFGRERLLRWFLPAQAVHPVYIVAMATLGAWGGYTWKGRKVSR
ncbi:MAG: glycosyltransferase [Bacteroidota bacterium]